jgi:hypothetical protein
MIHLTMTPEEWSIRLYDQPDGYAKRLPYLAIVRVKCLTDTTVYLCGAVGKINRRALIQAFDMLRERGVTTVMLERRGKMKTIQLQQCSPE